MSPHQTVLNQAVSIGALHCALYAGALAILACSGEIQETPQLQQGFAPLCGDPDAGSAGDPVDDSPDAAPAVPHFDCQVSLSKLSYDSPGADTAEFLELRIEGTLDSLGQRAKLGDCGLDHLALLNGGDASCASYRQIPLAAQVVPADGYFTLCSSDAQAVLGTVCDLSSWGTSRLSNGWLQNGPNDVIALIGQTSTHYAYEGVPAQCGDASWRDLPADTGEAIDGVDDTVAACGDEFLRLSLAQAPLRAPPQCPTAPQPDAATPVGEPTDPAISPTGNGSDPLNPSSTNGNDDGSLGRAALLDATVTDPHALATGPEAAAPPPLWHNYGVTPDASPLNPTAPPLASGCSMGLQAPRCPVPIIGLTLLALTAVKRRHATKSLKRLGC
ncbi:MAG TPA: hypothetical protein VHO25_02945 [Polyangiaceae bacterium]|nr:hypothetical protein [Polyangiaceae bacterium]